jgi:hypothetical protein
MRHNEGPGFSLTERMDQLRAIRKNVAGRKCDFNLFEMLLQDSARQKKGNTVAFIVALILILVLFLLLFIM